MHLVGSMSRLMILLLHSTHRGFGPVKSVNNLTPAMRQLLSRLPSYGIYFSSTFSAACIYSLRFCRIIGVAMQQPYDGNDSMQLAIDAFGPMPITPVALPR